MKHFVKTEVLYEKQAMFFSPLQLCFFKKDCQTAFWAETVNFPLSNIQKEESHCPQHGAI